MYKYRVWDKGRKKMSPVACIHFGDDGSALTIMIDPAPKGPNIPHVDLVKGENAVLMQFTGLQDRKGKEIYECDIVRINHPADRTDFTNVVGEVFWWQEEGGWYHTNNHGRPPKRMWQYVEVIGNIYESPELLEKRT